MLHCPSCKSSKSSVKNSNRADGPKDVLERRRQCLQCGQQYITYETVVHCVTLRQRKDKSDYKPVKNPNKLDRQRMLEDKLLAILG